VTDVVLDTNVFVASLVKRDAFHADAKGVIETVDSRKVRAHISRIVPVEVCTAVGRRTGKKEALEAQEVLRDWTKEGKVRVYDLNEKRMEDAQEIAVTAGLKGMDAIALQLAYELELPFKTYDKDIKKNAKKVRFI